MAYECMQDNIHCLISLRTVELLRTFEYCVSSYAVIQWSDLGTLGEVY